MQHCDDAISRSSPKFFAAQTAASLRVADALSLLAVAVERLFLSLVGSGSAEVSVAAAELFGGWL